MHCAECALWTKAAVLPSASFGAELATDAATVGLDPLLGEAALVVVAEDVGQLEGHPLPVRWQRPDRRLRELADKDSRDGGLARDVLTLHDHDAAVDRAVIERGAERREVTLETLVIKLAPVRPVKLEGRREVGIDLSLVLAGQLQLADADQPANEFVSAQASDHGAIFADSPKRGDFPLGVKRTTSACRPQRERGRAPRRRRRASRWASRVARMEQMAF